jgi:hypothetical protein
MIGKGISSQRSGKGRADRTGTSMCPHPAHLQSPAFSAVLSYGLLTRGLRKVKA